MYDYSSSITYKVVITVIILLSLFTSYKRRSFPALKYLALWLVIAVILMSMYLIKEPIISLKDRFVAELIPGHVIDKEGEIVVTKSNNGHFYLNSVVNGKNVRFMVDTGASNTVIPLNLAIELGYDPQQLKFDRIYQTANGTIKAAAITLEYVKLGEITLESVPAAVNNSRSNTALFGISALSMFSSYRFEGGNLYLTY